MEWGFGAHFSIPPQKNSIGNYLGPYINGLGENSDCKPREEQLNQDGWMSALMGSGRKRSCPVLPRDSSTP